MIPLHLIESFVIYAETQNLSQTAKILQQTQPSASRQVVQFQKYFKKALFNQRGRQKKLTPYGLEVHQYYRDSVMTLRSRRESFSNVSIQNTKAVLSLAARSEILQTYISRIKFKSPIELIALPGKEIREALEDCRVDMAVYHESFESFDYYRKKLFSDGWKVIVPKSWKLEIKNVESWLASAPPQAFASYDKTLEALRSHKLKINAPSQFNIQFISNDWRLLAEKVQQQACWSIVPAEYSNNSDCRAYPLDELMRSTQFYLYFKKENSKNEDVQFIYEQLK